MLQVIRHGLVAGTIAAVPSGLPSTIHAIATRRDPLEATAAAGTLLLPDDADRRLLILTAIPVHFALSALWGCVLSAALPRKKELAWGVGAGVAIAAVDLGIVGRHFDRIRKLPLLPQLADHVAFSAIASVVISRKRKEPG